MTTSTIISNNPFFQELASLYSKMDREWDNAAAFYGFRCTGCEENCCETEFYHHTLIEKNYLLSGFEQLSRETKKQIKKKAMTVCKKRVLAERKMEKIRIMCPLNKKGLCILYSFRPMICRLHGVPHELCRPGGEPVRMVGCHAGASLFNTKKYFKFDRTPFYSKMAKIEIKQRKATGKTEKIKQTVAEMLLY